MRVSPAAVQASALALTLALSSAAAATPIVDQDPIPYGRSYAIIGGEIQRAQSFTVGLGGQLTSFEVTLARDSIDGGEGTLTWGIYATSAGVPSESPLASGLLPVVFELGTREQVVSIDVSAAAIFVSPGDVLAWGVGNTAAHMVDDPWFIYGRNESEGPIYPGGEPFIRVTDGSSPGLESWTANSNEVDWMFRTYVDAEAVPEPGLAALVALGSLAALLRVRRRGVSRDSQRPHDPVLDASH